MTCHGLPLLDELFTLHAQVALLKQDVQGLGLKTTSIAVSKCDNYTVLNCFKLFSIVLKLFQLWVAIQWFKLYLLRGYAHASPQNCLFSGPGFGPSFCSNVAPASCNFIAWSAEVRCMHHLLGTTQNGKVPVFPTHAGCT